MKYELLKRSHVKRNILIAVVVVFVLSAIILNFTRAKYRTTQSMPLIQGTINFSPSDLNIVAMYLNQDGAIPAGQTDIAPKFGYTLNEEQSFCEVNDEKIEDAAFTYENGLLGFYNLNRKGTKCSVYFDLIPDSEKPILSISTTSTDNSITVVANASDNIGIYYYYFQLDNEEEIRLEENSYTFEGLEKDSIHTVTVRVEDAAGNVASDNKKVTVGYRAGDVILAASKPQGQTTDWTSNGTGITYYYEGDTNEVNNWVQFAGFWWRIIRINGDGSIRMIYQGTRANETGTGTQIRTSAFNSSCDNNMYVGYMYGSDSSDYNTTHTNTNPSTIKGILDSWYTNNIENEEKKLHYGQYIDGNAGFCGDRRVSSGTGGGTSETDYQPYTRIRNSSPSLSCEKADIYTIDEFEHGNGALTYPIGLISADEAMFAGIPNWNSSNSNNYLYTGQHYWTMSPYYFGSGGANVFFVDSSGSLYYGYHVAWRDPGVRPVINLKANVTILSGDGSSLNPYKITE